MEKTDDKLAKRLAEETAKIKVDSYQETAFQGGFAGGGRALWSTSILAGALAGAIGLVAPLFPALAGATTFATAISTIPVSLAVFTAVGMSTGFAGGLMLGRASGSAAAVAKEQERRIKDWAIQGILKQNPDAHIEHDEIAKPAAPQKNGLGARKTNILRLCEP